MKISPQLLTLTLLALTVTACSKDSDQNAEAAKDPDWQRGRAVYVANCVACHNNDPSKDGPIGPANKGSSRELLEARANLVGQGQCGSAVAAHGAWDSPAVARFLPLWVRLG